MALWREENPDVFAATIVTAAEQLHVQPLAVEKDYWVCEVLRTIAASHRDEIVFKGGTSLEKLRIIKRFSEDLDLLVLGEFPNVRTAKRAMLTMLETAASTTGGHYTDRKSGGRLADRFGLHPGRTLIEKLLRVNNFVVDPARRNTTHGLPRIGRQFYDIWALLGHDLVTELLADTAMVRDIVATLPPPAPRAWPVRMCRPTKTTSKPSPICTRGACPAPPSSA